MHRFALDTLCCMAAASALVAQTALEERIQAAAKAQAYWDTELAKVADTVSMASFLDAVAALRPQLQGHEVARIASMLDGRNEAVLAAWLHEPEQRRARAPVFGALRVPWLRRYHDGDAAERRDIEAVARWIPWRDGSLRSSLHAPVWRDDAATLMREAARGQRERGAFGLDAVQVLQGDQAKLTLVAVLLQTGFENPFALGPMLLDADPRLRLRAYILLRRCLQGHLSLTVEMPQHLLARLAEDPCRPFLNQVPALPIPDERIEGWIASIAAGGRPMGVLEVSERSPQALRKKLAKAMLDQALQASRDAGPSDPLADEAWREQYVGHACALDPTCVLRLLADAVNANDPRVALAAIEAASTYVREVAPEIARKMASLVGELLDHANPRVQAGAARLAGVVLAADPQSPLRERVVARALRVANAGVGQLHLRAAPIFCGTGPEPIGTPDGADATLVYLAATLGEVRLAPPLIAAVVAARAGADKRLVRPLFPLLCLEQLAPHLAADTADALWRELAKDLAVPARSERDATLGLTTRVEFRLWASVSEPVFAAMLAAMAPIEPYELLYSGAVATLPARRQRVLLERLGMQHPGASALHRHCPGLLAEAWQAGEPWAALAVDAVAVIRDWQWAEQQRVAGVSPVALLAKALVRTPLQVTVPFSLLVAVRDEAVGADWLASRLAVVPAVAADLEAWRQLAAAVPAPVALAAVRRLAELGDAGRAAAGPAIESLLAREDLAAVRDAWSIAVDLGIAVGDRTSLERRLAAHSDPNTKIVLQAIALRLDGWPPRNLDRASASQVLAIAGDVTLEQLAMVLPAPTTYDVQWLLRSRSAATMATALLAAAKDPWWDEQLERLVAFHTTHADPRVRAAAYHALGQRDPEVWPSALLVHEAEFDPDPLVQQEAPRRPR